MSILTMTQAVQIGIESIEKRDDIPTKTKENTIKLLCSLKEADWHKRWDKDSIIKTLNDYKEQTGITPTVSTLKEYGMPKGVTIRSIFHTSPSLFLKRLFAKNQNSKHINLEFSNPWGFETEKDWLDCFIEQFNKHKNNGMNDKLYNTLRDKNTPTWNTIARHCNLSKWSELMEMAGVKYPEKRIQTAKEICIVNISSPTIERLDFINKEKERLNSELYEILSTKK